eukprot:jgi/Tetstr1/454952/TSEL_041813.t1
MAFKRLHDSGPARRGVAPAAAWTVADALSVAGVAAGAAWAPRIDAAARSLQPARVRHHPADVLAFTEVAAAWLAKARAVLAERHRRRGARRAGGAGQSSVLPSPALPSVAAFRGVAAPPVVAPTPPEVGAPAGHPSSEASRARYPPPPTRPSPAGDGVGWGAVDHLSDVDMVHMPAEMSMETAVPIDFQEAWAEAQRCVNERVVAAMEANDPVVLDRALKWKYLLPQLLLRAPSRGGRRRLQALAWRFRAFAERRMTELVRSWDDARTDAFYAGHARQRRTDADLFAALLVGTADTVVALVEDGELSRAAGRLSSKGMGDLSDPDILAQLRDKHPSRSHPIPDAAYAIPVDEAALTVDMRVPYQQLKQHVAAGPSGMRNEYLRCLVGEYAPASGPAAVRAMSEVASMYLQGRMPGWFNRLFASARLVAPVKKLGEGRAPDVRPVAVGEAERRAAERAVVDNMKEAYVSVLAPSQLGVGIPAGDSVLIHGVRLIAEKLGPRAVIVHTDLRNAYNEAWRRTIIQRHIDCSPLHPVIPALLASLSTDSYLVVDDRSAPLRSEDGVQQGAPLATTSFCVAIHPEVQQCDTTLEVNDGAARFNADDGILVGLPEHVWPALHAFRTSIKASVGLEVRFDKMQAYSADMEAARRETPADIEWPELDGHHGIAVLNVPLGSREYVQAYMRGKAEELREEVDASLSKLLSAKPSRRYTHALHHHAWALLKHCMQHKAGYWLRNCLPSEVEAFAEAVDATILAAVERVLGVSFDPSTYGTDTNPVVTDFLAELLHDPDPMAAEVATLSEVAVARARSRLHLPTRLKGAGIRRMATVRDAAFIGCMNAILPRFLTRNSGTNTPTPGFFDPQLGSVLGRGSFNANSSARQYDHFLNDAHGSDSYAVEMREAWGRLQAATAGHLGDADARQMEREVEAASGSQKELTAFLDQANNSRLRNEVCALPATCRERILFNQLDAASGMWTVAIPTARTAMTPHELREVAAGYFFLPSPCLAPVVGCQIILPSTEHNPVIVDLYGDALMNLPAPGDAHWRVQHDAIADAFRDHCVHDLGIAVRREVDDLFQQAVPLGNTVPRDELKDLVPDAELSLPVFNVVTGSYDPRSLKSTLLEFKTMRYGVKYTSVPRATAVDRFERSLLGDIQRGLAARDAAWHNTEPGQKGPLRDILDMSEYTGMVFGTVETWKRAPSAWNVLLEMPADSASGSGGAAREDVSAAASAEAGGGGLREPLLAGQPQGEEHARPLSPTHRMNTAVGLWLMVISSLFFSLMTLLVKVGSNLGIPSFQLVFARSILQLLFALFSCAMAGIHPLGPRDKAGWMFARGACGALGLAAMFFAISVMDLGDATTIFFTGPVFTALFAYAFLGEALTGILVLASLLSTTGVTLVVRPAILFRHTVDPISAQAVLGAACALGGAVLAAAAYVIVRKPVVPDAQQWAVLLGVGVMAFLGQCCLNSGLQLAPAGPGTVMRNLDVVFAYVYQVTLLHDPANPLSVVGAALVVSSAVLLGVAKCASSRH